MSILHLGRARRETRGRLAGGILGRPDEQTVANETPPETVLDRTQALGAEQEGIRSALEQVSTLMSQLQAGHAELESARETLEQDFAARREERSELAALQSLTETLRTELGGSLRDQRKLQTRLDEVDQELRQSRLRIDDQDLTLGARDAEITRINAALEAAQTEAAELMGAADQLAQRLAEAQADRDARVARVNELETRRLELEAVVTRSTQALRLAEAERESVDRRAQTQSTDIANLHRTVAELTAQVEAEKARARTFETTLFEVQSEAARVSDAMNAQDSAHRLSLEASQSQLETSVARAERLEKELAAVQQQLRETTQNERASARDAAEAFQKSQRVDERIVATDAALAAARQELRTTESARSAAIERAERLADALASRERDMQRQEEKLAQLERKLAGMESELTESQSVTSERVRDLAETLERERSQHASTRGALDKARKDKARLHQELLKVVRHGGSAAVAPENDDEQIDLEESAQAG
jgi:chromosome segregation ATPase